MRRHKKRPWGVGYGTVFKIDTAGNNFLVLKTFDINGGAYPEAGLVIKGNTLYGTTFTGGTTGYGLVYKVNTDSSGFAVMKTFKGGRDGSFPESGLLLEGNTLYGTTSGGDTTSFLGTVFQIQTDNSGYSVLRSFTGSDGDTPQAGLTLLGNALFGTTYYGGNQSHGVVFSLQLSPFLNPISLTGGMATFKFAAISNVVYQVQYKTNLSQAGWINSGNPTTAASNSVSVSLPSTNTQSFFRVIFNP